MTLRMLDSIYPVNLPGGADAYLGYVDGAWATCAAIRSKFPGAHILCLAVFAQDDAEGCDCENGDLTPAQVPAWVARQHARGVARPVVYASISKMSNILGLLAAAGISRGQVRLLSAHYGMGPHICGPAAINGQPCYPGAPACDGTQWTDQAPGLNGSKIDESALHDDFFGGAMSANGPQNWDAADWKAVRMQMERGVLAHVANDYVQGLDPDEASNVHDAHAALAGLVKASAPVAQVDVAALATQITAALGPDVAAAVAVELSKRLAS